MTRAVHIALLASAALVGCGGGPSEPARMRESIEPYLDDMAGFDRWARRLSLADSAFRSEAAREEAAFAPLRRQRRIAAAWLVREGPDPQSLRHPSDAPELPTEGWVRVLTEDLGELTAQRRTLRIGDRERIFTLIRRSRDAPGGGVLHVTVACAPIE